MIFPQTQKYEVNTVNQYDFYMFYQLYFGFTIKMTNKDSVFTCISPHSSYIVLQNDYCHVASVQTLV